MRCGGLACDRRSRPATRSPSTVSIRSRRLPDGVGNAEAEAILPHAFAERLRPTAARTASGATGPSLQFSRFFPDAADGARAPACGSTPTCCCSSRSRSIRQNPISPGSGRASSAIPCSICRRTIRSSRRSQHLMQQDELTPDWLALRHRLTFALRKLRGGSSRLSDIRVAIYGPAALTALARRAGELHYALPKKSFYAVHAEPKLFFEPHGFFSADRRSRHHRACTFRRRAAATRPPFPAASMPGRRSGLAP